MLDDELVEWRARRHQHAAEALASARLSARRHVEAMVPGYPAITTASSDPDIDAQFERIRRPFTPGLRRHAGGVRSRAARAADNPARYPRMLSSGRAGHRRREDT